MPRRLTKNELEQLHLEPGESVVVEVERNLMPLWLALSPFAMALVVFGVTDPVFGWAVFFLGFVLIAFVGGVATSLRVFITNRRIVRIGAAGRRALPRRKASVAWSPAAFGEGLRMESGGESLRVRHVRNAEAVRAALAQIEVAA